MPHLNLAFDIIGGKCGMPQNFFSKFIQRANEFNHLLSRGKGYAQLEVSVMKNNRAVVTPFAAQCFLSSAINEWKTGQGISSFACSFFSYSFRGRRLSPRVQNV